MSCNTNSVALLPVAHAVLNQTSMTQKKTLNFVLPSESAVHTNINPLVQISVHFCLWSKFQYVRIILMNGQLHDRLLYVFLNHSISCGSLKNTTIVNGMIENGMVVGCGLK